MYGAVLAEGHAGSSAAACRSKPLCCCVTGRGLAAGVGDQGLVSDTYRETQGSEKDSILQNAECRLCSLQSSQGTELLLPLWLMLQTKALMTSCSSLFKCNPCLKGEVIQWKWRKTPKQKDGFFPFLKAAGIQRSELWGVWLPRSLGGPLGIAQSDQPRSTSVGGY